MPIVDSHKQQDDLRLIHWQGASLKAAPVPIPCCQSSQKQLHAGHNFEADSYLVPPGTISAFIVA